MGTRPFFNISTQKLTQLFDIAISQRDLATLKALANELKYRDRPAAQKLKREVNEFLKAQPQKSSQGTAPAAAVTQTAIEETHPEFVHSTAAPPFNAQVPNRMTEPHITERLKGLLEYVRQAAQLKGKPTLQVEQHNYFKAHEHELRGLPGIHFDIGTSEDDTWLRVDRLHESKAPAPSTPLLTAFIAQSNTPAKEPGLVTHVSRAQLITLGAEVPALAEGEDPAKPLAVDTLAIREQLHTELKTYIAHAWQPWAGKEKEVRKTISK